jgi:hypothetical protein
VGEETNGLSQFRIFVSSATSQLVSELFSSCFTLEKAGTLPLVPTLIFILIPQNRKALLPNADRVLRQDGAESTKLVIEPAVVGSCGLALGERLQERPRHG